MAITASGAGPRVNWANEAAALRFNCKQQWAMGQSSILTTTPDHYGIVVGFFNQALGFKENKNTPEDTKFEHRMRRCRSLEKLIGRPINSFKKLTQHETQVLIDRLKIPTEEKLKLSANGAELIRWADEQAEDNPDFFGEDQDDIRTQRNDPCPTHDRGTAQAPETESLSLPGDQRRQTYLLHLW